MEAADRDAAPVERRILRNLGFFGHFLHVHAGGRSGKRHMLSKLYLSGGQLSQRELQDYAGISAASLSELLSKLEAEGLVTRTRSDEDRRQMEIALTPEGRERAIALKEEVEAFEAACASCLTEDEQGELLGYLDRMAEHWRGMEREGVCA